MNLIYPCICSRKDLRLLPEKYPGFCKSKSNINLNCEHAIRIKTNNSLIYFNDEIHGIYSQNLAQLYGDFIIKRRDGVFAYQMAVVIDDYLQQVNHVVRGVDLIESTPRQIYLHQLLGFKIPQYMHVPILVDASGNKLSKQNLAAAVQNINVSSTLFNLLVLLKQNPPIALKTATITDILDWGIEHWNPNQLQKTHSLPAPS